MKYSRAYNQLFTWFDMSYVPYIPYINTLEQLKRCCHWESLNVVQYVILVIYKNFVNLFFIIKFTKMC